MHVPGLRFDRMRARVLLEPSGDEEPNRGPHEHDEDDAADELGERELPPQEIDITIPSSKTRFVEANWNAIAAAKLAPFWNSDFAIAIAA